MSHNRYSRCPIRRTIFCSRNFGFKISQNPSGGSIVNISSDLGLIAPDQSIYKVEGLDDNNQPDDFIEISDINSGWCGMAGSFGFEKEHFDISNQIGERELLPAIRNSSTETAIISEGVSCRQQIFSGTGKNSQHLVEILANSL